MSNVPEAAANQTADGAAASSMLSIAAAAANNHDNVATTNDQSFAQRQKCVCGWGEACLYYQRKLYDAKDSLNEILTLELPLDNQAAMALKWTIDEYLRVPASIKNLPGTVKHDGRKTVTYHLAKLHWTKNHMKRNEKRNNDFLTPLGAEEARKLLHKIHPTSIFQMDPHGQTATCVQSPTVPPEAVKAYVDKLTKLSTTALDLQPRAKASGTKKIHLSSFCICSWPECRAIQQAFTDRIDDGLDEPRGGNCYFLDFSNDKPKTHHWKQTVLACLNIHDDSFIKNPISVPVARHHWTLKQLEYFKTGGKVSTPLAADRIQELAYAFEPKYCLPKTKRYPELYYQTPNIPREVVLESVREATDEHRVEQLMRQREQSRLNALAKLTRKQVVQFQSLTFPDFQTLLNENESLKSCGESDKKTLEKLSAENAKLKADIKEKNLFLKEKDKLLKEHGLLEHHNGDISHHQNLNERTNSSNKRQRKLPSTMHFPEHDDLDPHHYYL
ncbi:hypothetical protein MPSEU_000954900 [Mayamaea pseudoterrestris]|nr:hypothetical protein MPSEU_000954900 [Mayamaea pseudoterrestris]